MTPNDVTYIRDNGNDLLLDGDKPLRDNWFNINMINKTCDISYKCCDCVNDDQWSIYTSHYQTEKSQSKRHAIANVWNAWIAFMFLISSAGYYLELVFMCIQWMPGVLCNTRYPSETHLKSKYREISFAYSLFMSYPIVLKFCSYHDSEAAVLCANF